MPVRKKILPRLAVFCSGFGSNFQALLDAVRRKQLRAEISLMVSDNPKAFAVRRAATCGVPLLVASPRLFSDRKEYETFLIGVLRNQKIDLVVLAGFMRIFTPHFIRAFRHRIVNVHPSYLPEFRGAHAIRDAFRAGVSSTGVTVHVVTAEVDSGPILAREKVKISPRDTLASLEKKIHRVEHALYPQAIQNYLRRMHK